MIDPKVSAIVQEMDAASNAIAARIQRILESSTGLSAESEAALNKVVADLKALGADSENPFPPVVG